MTAQDALEQAEAAGKQLVEDWFTAYNNVDAAHHRALVRFPMASFGGARSGRDNLSVAVRSEAGNWGADTAGQGVLYRDEEWDHSIILRQEVRQATADKTHVLTDFTRNHADGAAYGLGLSRLTIGIRDAEGWWIRILSSCGLRDPEHPETETDAEVSAKGREVVEQVVDALNARDLDRLRALCHFPFVRLPGAVLEAITDAPDLELPAESDSWARSEITMLDVPMPQAGDKVVVEVEVRRLDRDGNELEPEGAICLITRHGDRWGLQLCSTRAGLAGLP